MKRSRLHIATIAGAVALVGATGVSAQADLDDLEMAHVAVVASNIDIAYARIALDKSSNPEIRAFAETMIRDHSAVNEGVAALADKLGVTAKDNALSRQLLAGAEEIEAELRSLEGRAFDRRYAENEAAYHRTVNGVVADAFIPNIENAEVKAAFEAALEVFLVHQEHAEKLAAMAESWR
ncbi:MAG: DUF4142 domain-containing protein [Gemmatimonadetes bacterium]|nr:DUF4142 domain-containing protein [Gemmatimonadota bacterium]